MTDWTKIEAYTQARSFAWEAARHRVMYGPPIGDHSAFLAGLMADTMRRRVEFGGRQSGKSWAQRVAHEHEHRWVSKGNSTPRPTHWGWDMGKESK